MAPLFLTLWQYRKAALYTALVAAVALMGWRVSVWRDAFHNELPAALAALEAERLCDSGSACAARQAALEAAHIETNARVIESYEQELANVRNRPVRVVRLCPNPGDVQGARPTGPPDGTGSGAGQLSGQTGRDIGRELYDLAREADEVSARLRALQEWNAALAR